ncbi:MAG TPA: selenide, water dikinase SelD [Bacteroidia bacterium]|nr:selenide, water dikinase SelD [Bacteroidia bacterium]
MEKIRLTQYSHGSGCGCKIAPAELEKILSGNKSSLQIKELLVGNNTNDDAAVWDLGNGQVLISTVDFFLPVVDNAFDFGRIAAANSISDVYAMGGKPLFANAVLGWPIDKIPSAIATEVLNGARSICSEMNIPIAGGHSINSSDPIFGLAVNGIAAKANIKQNNTAKAGDLLYLTKPLGVGIMTTAIKRGLAQDEHITHTVELMCTVNSIGERLGALEAVHALTDVTGFGLLGHLLEIAEGSGLSAELDFSKVPVLPFLDTYLQQNCIPDNTFRNWNSWEKKVSGVEDLKSFQVLNDPQTSGGLLIAIAAGKAQELEALLDACALPVHCIGFMKPFNGQFIRVNV